MSQKINTNSLQLSRRLKGSINCIDSKAYTSTIMLSKITIQSQLYNVLNSLKQNTGFFSMSLSNGKIFLYSKNLSQRYLSPVINMTHWESLRNYTTTNLNHITPILPNVNVMLQDFSEITKTKAMGVNFLTQKSTSFRKQVITFVVAQSLSDYIINQISHPLKYRDLFFKQHLLLQSLLKFLGFLLIKSDNLYIFGIRVQIRGK